MNNLINPVIVVPAYNRPHSLARLLKSLAAADYPSVTKLVISLDGEASVDVRHVAHEFYSPKLQTKVIERVKRLGLKQHILECGDLSLKYGSVIILEDDLLVDRFFYHYAMSAHHNYAEFKSVAGIALYAHEYNEYVNLPFAPMRNGYSTYPMRIPCSWGQCWSAAQWKPFRDWHIGKNNEALHGINGIPDAVKNWSEKSWKKYFAAYLAQTDKYFIYPYNAYATNCASNGGTHVTAGTNLHQVSLSSQSRPIPQFNFCPVIAPDVAYDAFMEPCGENIYRSLGLGSELVEIDTLGIKPFSLLKKKKFTLSCRKPTKVIRQFPRSYRPIENNFLFDLIPIQPGGFYLAKSSSFDCASKHRRNLAEYSYFAGMNIESLAMAVSLLKVLPRLVYRYILSRIGSK